MTELIEQLNSPTSEVRHAALVASGGTDELSVARVLAGRLADAKYTEPERQLAAEALAKSTLPEIAAMLLPELASESPFTRTMAAMGLGGQCCGGTVKALVLGLTDPVNTVRNWSERSLLGMIPAVQQQGIEALIGLLAHSVALSRSPAARVLGQTHDDRALAPLMAMAKDDPEWLSRMGAIKALGDLGNLDAVELVAQAMQSDPKNRVRAAAAEAIGKLRPANAEALLRAVLEADEDDGVQKMAGEALRSLGFEVSEINDDGWE